MPKYAWQSLIGAPAKLYNFLNTRRNELLTDEKGESDEKAEWLALVEERDKIFQKIMQQENERILLSHYKTVQQSLTAIGEFDHSNTPQPLKRALCHLHKELGAFLRTKPQLRGEKINTENNLDTQANISTRRKRRSSGNVSGNSQDDFKPSTAIPINGNNGTRPKKTKKSPLKSSPAAKTTIRLPSSDGNISKMPDIKVQNISCDEIQTSLSDFLSSTPERDKDDDFEEKENLKESSDTESTVGNQYKRNVRLDMTHANDLVTHALRQKFVNVRKLYGSPLLAESININESKEEFLHSTESVD